MSARAIALVLSLSFAGSVAAQTPAPDLSRVEIKNFGRLNEHYYRGAQPEDEDYTALKNLGIKTVIDLQADSKVYDHEQQVRSAGMQFVRIPMTTRVEPTLEQVNQFLQIVNDPAAQPVYVHCKGGRHRTGVMTAVYRMTNHGWSPAQAFGEMKDFDFGWDFLHPEFKRYVFAFPQLQKLVANPSPASLN